MTTAIDFSHYLPPGVYTQSMPGPQLAVNSSLPTAVGIIGQALGYRTFIQTVQINTDIDDTHPSPTQTLANSGIDKTTIIVRNTSTGVPYGTAILNNGVATGKYDGSGQYTVVLISGTDGTSNALYAIERVIGGHINQGDYVQVSYNYTDPTYYTPYIFYDYDDVRAAYGDPFNVSTGTIQSELSLMAKFAFLNGAYQVVCNAVLSSTSPGNATIGDYGNALDNLKDQALVAVVVAATGAQPLQALIQEHVDQQSSSRFERRAILGLDGTTVAVPSSTRIIDAQELTDQRLLMVSPATFNYFSPELNTSITLGGQFMAACLAGMTVAMSFAMPLTRKRIAGWTGVAEFMQEGQKNLESQNGLCVIEKTRSQLIQVRHGITTDPTDLLSREWSIIGQQDAMVYRMRDYLESDNLIGQPIYPFTLTNVKGSAEAALQSLIRDGLIVDYIGLKVRQLATNPDVLEVSYSWLPAFPLNYIVVTFNVTLSTGTVTSTTGSSANQANVSSTSQTNTNVGIPTSSSINDFGGDSNTLQST